jgi:elongation factor G
MAPTPRGAGYTFVNAIVGGSIPSKFIPAVDRGIQEASARGVLAGYPMVDFQVELYDGSYHSVDSNEMSFKLAGILAFKTVAQKCKPILLEPLEELEITTPDLYLGDVLGDISARRGQILGTDSVPGGKSRIRAIVPQAEMHLYATDLFSKTHGHGTFVQKFKGYEQMPAEASHRVVTESRGMKEAVGE